MFLFKASNSVPEDCPDLPGPFEFFLLNICLVKIGFGNEETKTTLGFEHSTAQFVGGIRKSTGPQSPSMTIAGREGAGVVWRHGPARPAMGAAAHLPDQQSPSMATAGREGAHAPARPATAIDGDSVESWPKSCRFESPFQKNVL